MKPKFGLIQKQKTRREGEGKKGGKEIVQLCRTTRMKKLIM